LFCLCDDSVFQGVHHLLNEIAQQLISRIFEFHLVDVEVLDFEGVEFLL
jgi:hypothetical protein